jgi:oligoribonuclease
VFLDLETTGLSPEADVILEIGIVVVDPVAWDTGRVCWSVPVKASSLELLRMDDFVREMHTKSGLLSALSDGVSVGAAETGALGFLVANNFQAKRATMAGYSLHFDRAFLHRHMPSLDKFLDYRMVDVSTIRGLASRYTDPLVEQRIKAIFGEPKHRAIDDCLSAIEELKLYAKNFLDPVQLDNALLDLEHDG